MTTRLVLAFVRQADAEATLDLARRHARRVWCFPAHDEQECVVGVVQGRYVERLIGELEAACGKQPGFSVAVLPIEALVPPLHETVETALPAPGERAPTRIEAFFSRDRLSTEELYDDIEESLQLRPSFLFTVLASALIAGLGMRSGQTAIVIGAMVIAPFLGPSIGLAMAATVGDFALGRRAAMAIGVGGALVLALMGAVGHFIDVDATVPELNSRTVVSPADLVLALASGAAGVLAFSRGTALSLVGVMIAVALVPPLAAAGLLLGSGQTFLSAKAIFLFATNLVCINVAGIATFLLQGLPPKSWRLTGAIFALWMALLVSAGALVALGLRVVLPSDLVPW